MTRRSDEVDRKQAQAFAWGGTGEAVDENEGFDEAQLQQLQLRAARVAADVATALSQARQAATAQERDAAHVAILKRCAELDFELGALASPHAGWLVRAWLQHAHLLDEPTARAALSALLRGGLADVEERWDLLAEGSAAGNMDVVVMLAPRDGEGNALPPRTVDALARQLVSGSPEAQVLAGFLLSLGAYPQAIPALRTALATRDLDLRSSALRALLACGPEALGADTLVGLVAEALQRRSNWTYRANDPEEGFRAYELKLLRAAQLLRPTGLAAVARPYVDLEKGEGRPEWALELFAVGAPEEAAALVDRLLVAGGSHRRELAVRLAALLPPDLARPRLERLADDPEAAVVREAREAWLTLFSESCPVPRTAGLLQRFLEGPPSEDFLARLALLEGPDEVRAKLVTKLLEEPASRENFVLLVRCLDTGHNLRDVAMRESGEFLARAVPKYPKTLVAEAVLALVEDPRRREAAIDLVGALGEAGVWPARAIPKARALALEALAAADHHPALRIFTCLGLPASQWRPIFELLAPPLREHESEEHSEASPLERRAFEALGTVGTCPALNEAILEKLRDPAAISPWTVYFLAKLAAQRRLRRQQPAVLAWLNARPSGSAISPYAEVATGLMKAGVLPPNWAEAQLRDPSNPLFGVGARLHFHMRREPETLLRLFNPVPREGFAAFELLDAWQDRVLPAKVKRAIPGLVSSASTAALAWHLNSRFVDDDEVELPAEVLVRLISEAPESQARSLSWRVRDLPVAQRDVLLALVREVASPERRAFLEKLDAQRLIPESYWTSTAMTSVLGDRPGGTGGSGDEDADDDLDDLDDDDLDEDPDEVAEPT